MHLIDSHAHLFAEEFDQDRDEVIQRAKTAGVEKIFLPNIDLTTIQSMMTLCISHPEYFYPMLGLHPTSVKEDYKEVLEKLFTNFDAGIYAAIGEIGIDLYWDKTFIKEQVDAFEQQVILAKKHHLPIVIHVRESFEEVFSVINRQNDDDLRGVFHCFTGTKEQAQHIIDYGGFKMGIGGVVTFKNGGIDKFLNQIPLEYLVLETDSPYLAPVPYRGKRNESAYLQNIVRKVAEIYGRDVEEIAEITSRNCIEIFKI